MKFAIVGAGLAGATAAHLLKRKGHTISVYETREHVGGNCYDAPMGDGDILTHMYGGHIFHTNHKFIWEFLKRFTSFNYYKHKVIALTENGQFYLPIMEKHKLNSDEIYKLVFKDYSEKQWGISFNELPDEIKNRIPEKNKKNDAFFFHDILEGMPYRGYTEMILNMFDKIPVHVGCDEDYWRKSDADIILYSGSIDELFDEERRLKYRSLKIEFKQEEKQKFGVINYCTHDFPYTRSIDHSFWHGKENKYSVISYEYPCEYEKKSGLIPYYPYPDAYNKQLYNYFKNKLPMNVIPIGRLGLYKYMNMDETIFSTGEILTNMGFI